MRRLRAIIPVRYRSRSRSGVLAADVFMGGGGARNIREVKQTHLLSTLKSSSCWCCCPRRWGLSGECGGSEEQPYFNSSHQASGAVASALAPPMAGSSEDERRRRRHRRGPADLRDAEAPEEGELVPWCDDSDVNTDDYYNNHHYYSSSDTDETTSDCNYARSVVLPLSYAAAAAAANNNGNAASSSPVVAAPAPAVLACPVCGKEFRSRKAVCGHMKVHQQGTSTSTIGRRHEQQGVGKHKEMKRNAAVAAGWGGTGRRGCSGCWSKPASPNAAQSDQSMAIVVANPKAVLQPMPLAFAMPVPMEPQPATPNPSSVPMASATPNPSSVPIASTTTHVSDESSSAKTMHCDALETVVAGAANPPTEADDVHLADAARAPPSPPSAGMHMHTASVHQQLIASPPPPPPDAEEERVQHPAVHHPHPIAPPLAVAGRQNPNGYRCKQCGVWFAMHQGLGGHMAGHKTRELAAVPCRGDAAKPEKVHVCRICAAEFPTGVQLGGHMRKHYTGAPIVPKKKPRLAVQPLPPPAEQRALEPAPRPAVAGRFRLFGVDIEAGPQMPAAAQEEGSSATQAPSASTGGEQ